MMKSAYFFSALAALVLAVGCEVSSDDDDNDDFGSGGSGDTSGTDAGSGATDDSGGTSGTGGAGGAGDESGGTSGSGGTPGAIEAYCETVCVCDDESAADCETDCAELEECVAGKLSEDGEACVNAGNALTACIGALECEENDAYWAKDGDYPCKAEDEAVAEDCLNYDAMYEECDAGPVEDDTAFITDYCERMCELDEECDVVGADCVADCELVETCVYSSAPDQDCEDAIKAVDVCLTGLADCDDYDDYDTGEEGYPCEAEDEAYAAACPTGLYTACEP